MSLLPFTAELPERTVHPPRGRGMFTGVDQSLLLDTSGLGAHEIPKWKCQVDRRLGFGVEGRDLG